MIATVHIMINSSYAFIVIQAWYSSIYREFFILRQSFLSLKFTHIVQWSLLCHGCIQTSISSTTCCLYHITIIEANLLLPVVSPHLYCYHSHVMPILSLYWHQCQPAILPTHCTQLTNHNLWTLYFDTSRNTHGVDVACLLIDLFDIQTYFSYHLESKCTDNDAEYEALIQGLMKTIDLNVKSI